MKNLLYILPIIIILSGRCKADKKKEIIVEKVDNEVYSGTDDSDLIKIPATYPGGISEFYNFLSKNIKYPKTAFDNNKEETVRLAFTITRNGSIANIKILDTVGFGIDREAIRVLKISKKWKPAIDITGKSTETRLAIPIKFTLSN